MNPFNLPDFPTLPPISSKSLFSIVRPGSLHFRRFFFPIVVNFYLVVSFETFDEGLHVGNFVVETDRIWVHRIAIGKSGITVKKKKEKKLENRKEN